MKLIRLQSVVVRHKIKSHKGYSPTASQTLLLLYPPLPSGVTHPRSIRREASTRDLGPHRFPHHHQTGGPLGVLVNQLTIRAAVEPSSSLGSRCGRKGESSVGGMTLTPHQVHTWDTKEARGASAASCNAALDVWMYVWMRRGVEKGSMAVY